MPVLLGNRDATPVSRLQDIDEPGIQVAIVGAAVTTIARLG
jgi:hypothetical protein